jgi:prolyl-tRNA synthetase
MRVSKFVVKTLREAPTGAELPSHVFLLRGGYVKQLASGLYSMMPLGKRVLQKIEGVIREEMNAIDGQEVELPLAQPAELWEESGRYAAIGAEMLRFKDRGEHPMVLAMTHEEAVTDLARYYLSSYKQLPFVLYQFQLKFRDEPRSRGGLVRVREFTMKDAYSFHRTHEDLDAYYVKAYAAYERIFNRVGVKPVIVQSDTGIMGGKVAHEFMLETEYGEDYLILSEDGTYSANQEIAVFDRESVKEEHAAREKVATPGKKTIEEVTGFLNTDPKHAMKAVLFETELGGRKTLVFAVVRGDLEASDIKIRNHLKAPFLLPAQDEFIRSFGIVPGYASPVDIASRHDLIVLADVSITEGNNFVGGANEEGFHYTNVNFGRDFAVVPENVGDFAKAEAGHMAPGGKSRLRAVRGIEIGNIFKLGTKFTESMSCQYLDEAGKHQTPIMGCYGIGVGRLMASVIENSHDDFGPIWPKEITPFHVHLVNIGQEAEVVAACEGLMAELEAAGFEVLYDDRDERPGVKFKDADLWGVPVRVAVGKKTLANEAGPSVEWKLRSEKEFTLVKTGDVAAKLKEWYGRT